MPPPTSSKSAPHIEECAKRIRVYFGGQCIVDTKRALLVWDSYSPSYFFANSDVPQKYLKLRGDGTVPGTTIYDIVVGRRTAPEAATQYDPNGSSLLAGLTKITYPAVDAWFEEDEQMFGHPKNPYHRVDVLQSSRHVRVEVDGVEVANTTKPRLLFETGLRVRTYVPVTDCRIDLLVPSELKTICPYKGTASYYSIRLPGQESLKENIVWYYMTPLAECLAIRGFLAFYDEKVDVWVDGEKQERLARVK